MCPRFYTGHGKHAKKIFFVKSNTHWRNRRAGQKSNAVSAKSAASRIKSRRGSWNSLLQTIGYFDGTVNFFCIAATICAQVRVVDALFPAAMPLA